VQATGEATRKRNAEAGSALTADDFAALPPAQRVSAVAQGYTAHLDSVPQLSRAEITELEPAEINQSRRLGMLDAVLAGKPAV
jgi:hypothetical protein